MPSSLVPVYHIRRVAIGPAAHGTSRIIGRQLHLTHANLSDCCWIIGTAWMS